MTKPKRRPRRGCGARKRTENFVVWFEHIGAYYDDVLVSLRYDKRAVAAITGLPSWAGWWDPDFQVWRIHPGHAEPLAAGLQDLGYTIWTT